MNRIFLGEPPANIKQWIIADYNRKQEEEKLKIPLCFEIYGPQATITLKCNGNNLKTATFQTSFDGQNWTDYTYETPITASENPGDKVYFKAKTDNTSITRDSSNYLQFTCKQVKVSGNVMSLLAPEFSKLRQVSPYCFYNLFSNCIETDDFGSMTLPATILARSCYENMFSHCFNMTKAPDLPATTLADYCYDSMFTNCTALSKAPDLPATTLANYCYSDMFRYCTSLTQAPVIKTYKPTIHAYSWMLAMSTPGQWDGILSTCIWNDLTLSEAEAMVLNDSIFGQFDPGNGVRISITCKDGSGVAYFDSEKYSWVFEY